MQAVSMAHRKSPQSSKKVIRVKLGQSCVSIWVRDNTKMIEKLKGEN
jgi:chemotaxis receptor (MCP) glutamine deamidase CheD